MSDPVVVGYTATDAGRDALAVGARLAAASASDLHLVLVLPADDRSVITPPDAAYDRHLHALAAQWLADAAAEVAHPAARRTAVRVAESSAAGLVAAADEAGASFIVVGAANGGLRGRHRLGTVATELLHSSDVPVVLAPEGSADDPSTGVTRVTAAIGTRPGAEALLDEAVALAHATEAPLRLVSLVAVDLPSGLDTGVIRLAGSAHAGEVLAAAQRRLDGGVETEVVVAAADSVEDAVEGLDWQSGEVLLVGSSRLAQPRRLFLGSTAAKIVRALPVPMIVVPRTRASAGATGPSAVSASSPSTGSATEEER